MSTFPKRKTLLAGSLALFLGAILQLPALAAHHEHEEGKSSSSGSSGQSQEHKSGTMGGEHKMNKEEHEKMMEDMHEQHMDNGNMDHSDQKAPDDEEGDYEGDDAEE